jgi:glycosyltransferase involved in cell wall biosynthesis
MATAATRTGGPPAFVGGSALELARLGHAMRVISTDLALAPAGVLQRQRRMEGADLHPSLRAIDGGVFPARFPRRLAFSPALGRAARQMAKDSDVVHLHNLWQHPQYAGYKAAIRAGVPYVVSPHGGFDPYLREHGWLRKALVMRVWQADMLDRATLLHVTTVDEERHLADVAAHVPRAVVPCGIHVADFETLPPPETFRDRWLGGYEGDVVLFLGRLTYKKGLDVLVRAFAAVRREHECRLVVVGPDDENMTSGLKQLAADLGVAGDSLFLGPLYDEDRDAALAGADVWALPSHAENFGIAVIEAMAAGCPVVISPHVNLADEVAAADAGVIADLDPEVFADRVLGVLTDGSRRARLQAAGRAFAARYDWSVLGARLVEMYQNAIRTGPGSPA